MKHLIWIAAIAGLFASCKKKEPTATDYLTQSKWKLTSVLVFGSDLSQNMKACQKDNLYQFASNKTITAFEGASKCVDTAANSRTDGNWQLANADKQLTLSGSSIAESFGIQGNLTVDILTLDATTLAVKKDTAISGLRTTINITFTSAK